MVQESTDEIWDTEEGLIDQPIRVLAEMSPYKKAEDEKGHGITLAARVTGSINRVVTQLLEQKGSPYGVKSDIVRDSVFIGLKVLCLRSKLKDWEVEARLADITAETVEDNRVKENVATFVTELQHLSNSGEKVRATNHLNNYLEAISSISSTWREKKYTEALNSHSVVKELLDETS